MKPVLALLWAKKWGALKVFAMTVNNVRYICPSAMNTYFFSFGATAPIWALAYLHETLRFTSVF
jgi:hypothetical protein